MTKKCRPMLYCLIVYTIWEILGFTVQNFLIYAFPQLTNTVLGNYIFTFLAEFIVFGICFIIFKKQVYSLTNENGTFLFTALLPVYISVLEDIYILVVNNANNQILSLKSVESFFAILLATISISLCEEFIWRKVIFLKLLNEWSKTKKGILCSVIISSALFGLCHYMNMLTGNQSFLQTTLQVLSSICMGIFSSGVFYRTGRIIFPIMIHCIGDFSNLFMNEILNYSYDLPLADTFLQIMVSLLYFIIGVYVVLTSKKYSTARK